MLRYLLNLIVFGVLFPDFLERRFPNEFRNGVMSFSYNCIFYYSKLQIYMFKLNNYLNTLIESNPKLQAAKQKFITYMNQFKKQRESLRIEFVKNGTLHTDPLENYDFIMVSKLIDNCLQMKILEHADCLNSELKFEKSNIKFILVEFKVGENAYRIDLSNEEYNYYLVGNIFTRSFFVFYIQHYLNITQTITDNDICSLRIIDHDVNKIDVDFTDKNESILLDKSGYNVIF